MEVVVFSVKPYDRRVLDGANAAAGHRLVYREARLSEHTAVLAAGARAICAFVNDDLGRATLEALGRAGVRMVALRSAGFNHVDLAAARELGIAVGRVPAYSPHAVAEHTMGLILALNRKIHKAYNRVREGNFALDGLLGFDLNGKHAGVVGTGKIGQAMCRILAGFGCKVLASDPFPSPACVALGVRYVALEDLFATSDIVTLHCPLTPQSHRMVDAAALGRMKQGVMLINTSRGAVVDTQAVLGALKAGRIGALGLDVYEEEADLFFEDLSAGFIRDDLFARLLTFPNVLITGHQAFFTQEALANIAEATIANLSAFEERGAPLHPVSVEMIAGRPPAS
jgi:D-lactate dehydrogenase